MKINCIVIDDEPLARKGLSNFIQELPMLQLGGIFSNPVEAMTYMNQQHVQLIFLDIQMPKMNGLEFLKTLPQSPVVIITTAFPNYALESYELDVMDYLVKPIPFERFVKAVNKARDYINLIARGDQANHPQEDYFFIKCENRYEKIAYNDLLYVEALQNYVVLHTTQKRFISYLTFKGVEEYLPSDRFLKVHKSFIVALSHIESIDGSELIIRNQRISISRSNKDVIMNIILKNRLLKR